MATKYPLLLISFILLITVHYSSCRRKPAQRCPRSELVRDNLKVKIRSNGFIAKLKCRRGYTMVEGDPNLTCLRNTWRGRVPKCIASGCEYIHVIPNGEGTYLYDDAMVRFACSPGYELQGSSTLTCDGTFWNDTIPACVGKGSTDLSCDFEDAGICGWSNDPSVDFDWVRNPGLGSSTLIGTGPRSDHTLGTPEGHFMYVDASIQRNEGEKARLYSPVYSPDLTAIRPTCFAFYYHMYGHTSGSMNVYIKREDQHSRHMTPLLQTSGFNPNKWMLQLIHIDLLDVNFQIVFEVEYSSGSMSDVAVDDVLLTSGEECAFFENLMKGGGAVHTTFESPATTSLTAVNTTTAVPITIAFEVITTSPTPSIAPTTTTTPTTTTPITTTTASAKITSTSTKSTTVHITTPSTTSLRVSTEKTDTTTIVTKGITTTPYLNKNQTTAVITTTPAATKLPPATVTRPPLTTTDVITKGTTEPTSPFPSFDTSTRRSTTTTTIEPKTKATEAEPITEVTGTSGTTAIATTKRTPTNTEPISTTERPTTSLEVKPSTRISTRTETRSSTKSSIESSTRSSTKASIGSSTTFSTKSLIGSPTRSSTRTSTSSTSTTSSSLPPTAPMSNRSADNAGFSSITISIIAFVVVAVVLAVIISVSVYVWRIRRQEKLPEDSEIRFLARDEVQMDGNIFSLGSRPPPRSG